MNSNLEVEFPIRLLLIAPSLRIVGGQSVQAELLRHELSQREVSVRFLPVDIRAAGFIGWLQRIKYLRTVLNVLPFLARLLAESIETDVIHVFSGAYACFHLVAAPVLILGKLLGIPVILHYHDGRAKDHLDHSRIARALIRLARVLVVPSGFLVDQFACFGLSAHIIPNAVDGSSFPYRERASLHPVFLHNRGMEKVYNVPCALRAFAMIQQKYPEASLTLAHDGPLRASLERMACRLGLRNVRFTGAVTQRQMAELYDEADVYLSTADCDNLPGSVLECFAAGLPVVVTRAGGTPWLVQHDRNGMIAPCGDHEALAAAAFRLLESPGLAQRLAWQANADCRAYSCHEVGPKWVALYRRLVQESADAAWEIARSKSTAAAR